ncbi:MAG: prolyl oligopeptidase family serine peptidase [Caulobacterales bacterium]|nr:prolyl oligopeptidase family serine peptidase [Caulobacterales bacterium]
MRLFAALAFAAAMIALPAQAAVGFQHFTIPDPQGQPLEVGVWYPTDAQPRAERLELGTQTVADDAPVRGDHLPLILMSHGHGGSYAGHADTAIALAEAGFVAAAVTHNGDNWQDTTRATEIWERPRQLKVLTDYMLGGWAARDRIDPHRIGAFGFSAGGFTVLMTAGAEPDLKSMVQHCRERPAFEDCRVVASQPLDVNRKVTWTHDPRVRAIVSAAPGLGFAFGKAGLANVRVPVQLWRGQDDPVLPHPFYAEAVRQALPHAPEMHVVPHAGHYDFISPCPPAMAQRLPEICVSEPGFDRAAFHVRFNAAVVNFFRRTLR